MIAAADPMTLAARAGALPPAQRKTLLAAIQRLRQADGPGGGRWGARAASDIETIVAALTAQAAREASEAQLVDKLAAAGELRPSLLIVALNQQRLSLFAAALARLGGVTSDQVRRAMDDPTPELLALACQTVGIDKAAFATLLAGVREANAGRPGGGASGLRRALGVFEMFSPPAAASAFNQVIGRV